MGKKLLIENGTSLNEFLSHKEVATIVRNELVRALANNGVNLVIVDLENKRRYEHSARGKLYVLGEDIITEMILAIEGTLQVH